MVATSSGQLAFVAEVTPGTTPATPAFSVIDVVSEDLAMTANQIRSNSVTAVRTVAKSRRASAEVGNGFSIELCKGTEIDALLAALMGNTWSGTAPNIRSKAGGSTLTSFTFERKINSSMYRRFTGCRLNTLALSLQPEQFVTAQFGVIGASEVTATSAIASSTYAAANSANKLTALDVASATFANGVTGSFDFAGLSVNITNNLTAMKRLGASPTRGIIAGQAQITGQLQIYVDANTLADAFIAETTFDLTVPMLNGSEGYSLEMQNIAITGYSDPNPGNGSEYIATIDFECTHDSTFGSSFGFIKTS